MANFVFYDFETCSSNVSYGQIIQAAAVLVNDNFQELDRYEARCKLNPGIVPEAMALLVNKSVFTLDWNHLRNYRCAPVKVFGITTHYNVKI